MGGRKGEVFFCVRFFEKIWNFYCWEKSDGVVSQKSDFRITTEIRSTPTGDIPLIRLTFSKMYFYRKTVVRRRMIKARLHGYLRSDTSPNSVAVPLRCERYKDAAFNLGEPKHLLLKITNSTPKTEGVSSAPKSIRTNAIEASEILKATPRSESLTHVGSVCSDGANRCQTLGSIC